MRGRVADVGALTLGAVAGLNVSGLALPIAVALRWVLALRLAALWSLRLAEAALAWWLPLWSLTKAALFRGVSLHRRTGWDHVWRAVGIVFVIAHLIAPCAPRVGATKN